ncbi:GntR family transcriptional regulator [Rhodobacteraceae bacterium N5(2021)]|uniref:GntR family transcriptional regulator n=1 Tax=Gymnodinialimonas phycosphaerae TaxID=2841589 RepID=A0A975TWN5_9RHOB|nr:GntR family transcriptional regulator [Gymnodinialimonas phycosphaerae]MBY4891270.1 GntR family transcriptional regulator [Gymnodinialimonas phycosphaerae]
MESTQSNVDRLTAQLRRMAADFEIKPEERIVEGEMAKRLNVSRTPLREALNRLVSEGYLTNTGGRGFFCRALTPARIMDLYETRAALECEALRLTIARASNADIAAHSATLQSAAPTADRLALLEMDEAFHLGLTSLCGNAEIMRLLENINGRIRYVRMIGLDASGGVAAQSDAHRQIMQAVHARDVGAALAALRSHIQLRKEDATQAVRDAFSEIYVRAG